MPPEGMVHALEMISVILKPGGCLVDIHPTPVPADLVVRQGELEIPVGIVLETDDYIEYTQAEAAQVSVLSADVYDLEFRDVFQFEIIASTMEELSAFFASEWRDAYLTPEVKERAVRLLGEISESYLMVRESITIARMCTLDKVPTS